MTPKVTVAEVVLDSSGFASDRRRFPGGSTAGARTLNGVDQGGFPGSDWVMLIEDDGPNACRLALRVVPGSRKSAVVGPLGKRLKVKVAAPPEDGRANTAVCELLAGTLGLGRKAVTVVSGMTNPEKTVRVEGMSAGEMRKKLGI